MGARAHGGPAGEAGSGAQADTGDGVHGRSRVEPAAPLRAGVRAARAPGFGRTGRYELLVTLGRLGLYELRADSLHLAGTRGTSTEDPTMLAAKRVFAIGDPLLLERRAATLAEAVSVPVEALDLALANWLSPLRATLGFPPHTSDERTRERAARGARRVSRRPRAHAPAASARGVTAREIAVHTAAYSGQVSRFQPLQESRMPLCFIEPQDAIRVIAESVGREARRQLVGEVVRAWVDDIPDQELSVHYAKAIADLDEDDLHLLAAWHASLEVGQPIPNTEFLVGVFPSLGENRREALKIAAGFRGEEAFQAGVAEDQALDTVLPRLSRERAIELANECIQLYMWDRLGCDN